MKPETRFKNYIRPILETIPSSCWEKIQQVVIRGTPDFVGVVNGRAVVIELKVGHNDTDALQEYKLDKWRKAGALAFVMTPDNKYEILATLTHIGRSK